MTDAKFTALPPGTKLVKADVLLWKRGDGKVFFHCESKGQVVSHRYGPYDSPEEVMAAVKAPLPEDKNCGPIDHFQLGRLRRALKNAEKGGTHG